MDARVTRAFDGVPDGMIHPRRIAAGEIISGDLARVALESGWAEEIRAVGETSSPALDKLSKAELEQLAAERKIDISAAKTKADIIAALEAA